MIDLYIHLMRELGLTLAVASSTYALIFFYKATADGTVDATERSFMHTVYFVLRIGLLLLIGAEALGVFLYEMYGSSAEYFYTPVFYGRVTLLSVIVANAFLMQWRIMPMWLGPALAGGSWYAYFLLNTIPLYVYSYGELFRLYVGFLILAVLFHHVMVLLTRRLYKPIRS